MSWEGQVENGCLGTKTWTYQVEGDVAGVLIEQVCYERDGDEENPYSCGFGEDPQDGLGMNKVKIIPI